MFLTSYYEVLDFFFKTYLKTFYLTEPKPATACSAILVKIMRRLTWQCIFCKKKYFENKYKEAYYF
jgi:hypothetical protein